MKTTIQKKYNSSNTLQAVIQQKRTKQFKDSRPNTVTQRQIWQNIQPVQKQEKPNNTGLPDNLKTGIENLSGYSMDDVKVHYNSPKPAQLQAHAYAQGTDIHIASGQEKHLAHEAWHVVQQKQGRVKPTMQMQGMNVNDDLALENEADTMGSKALNHAFPFQMKTIQTQINPNTIQLQKGNKNTSDYRDEYYAQEEEDYQIYQEEEDELWSDYYNVIEYAHNQLNQRHYNNWNGTEVLYDQQRKPYVRFIWRLGYQVTVGANVHYELVNGTYQKIAGNMYIKDIKKYEERTPSQIVQNAPNTLPRTTMTWQNI